MMMADGWWLEELWRASDLMQVVYTYIHLLPLNKFPYHLFIIHKLQMLRANVVDAYFMEFTIMSCTRNLMTLLRCRNRVWVRKVPPVQSTKLLLRFIIGLCVCSVFGAFFFDMPLFPLPGGWKTAVPGEKLWRATILNLFLFEPNRLNSPLEAPKQYSRDSFHVHWNTAGQYPRFDTISRRAPSSKDSSQGKVNVAFCCSHRGQAQIAHEKAQEGR